MKKMSFLIVVFVFNTSAAFAQTLALADLISLGTKNSWIDVDRSLTGKGWVYHDSEKGDEDRFDIVSWSYKKDTYSDKALAWMHAYESDGKLKLISYTVFNRPAYNIIQKGIAASGFKIVDSKINNEEVETVYDSKNHRIKVSYSKRLKEDYEYNETSLTAYSVTIIKKENAYDEGTDGSGTFVDDEGNTVEYSMKDNKLNGLIKIYSPDGKLVKVSNAANGAKNGITKKYDDLGRITYESYYVNDELNGLSTEFYYLESGDIFNYSGYYLDGEKNGLWHLKVKEEQQQRFLKMHTFRSGVLDGPFKEISNDSLIFGSYKNDELNGRYLVYTSQIASIFGVMEWDSSGSVRICDGNHYQGLKSGNWKEYSIKGSLISDGNYRDNERYGDWKFYHDQFEPADKYAKYSGKLISVTHYESGMKNGKSIQYAYYDTRKVRCDLQKYPDKTPLDTCYENIIIPEYSTVYYKDDYLYGPVEIKDSADNTIVRGVYKNDLRDGAFTEAIMRENETGDPYYDFEEGTYKEGKREGLWKSYKHPAIVSQTYYYLNGELEGKNIYYNTAGSPTKEVYYSKGDVAYIALFKSADNTIGEKYEIAEKGISRMHVKYITYHSGEESQVYWLSVRDGDKFFGEWLDAVFKLRLIEKNNEENNLLKDGAYLLKDTNGNKLIEGQYVMGRKHRTWTNYYPGYGLYSTQEYKMDVPEMEYYFSEKTKASFKGELKLYHTNGKLKAEIDISNGLRDGKSKYYDETGNKQKIEKYKNGIMQ